MPLTIEALEEIIFIKTMEKLEDNFKVELSKIWCGGVNWIDLAHRVQWCVSFRTQ
jgi:hypothetical protein